MAAQRLETWEVKEPYLNLHCSLGEGPYYEKKTNSLRFVDIINKRLHTIDLSKGPDSLETLQLDAPVTVTADIEGVDPKDKILIGVKFGAAILDRKSGKYEYLTKFATEDNPRLRSNDGAVDPHGYFWVGTMTDFGQGPFKPEGSVHRFKGKDAAETIRTGVTIPNSVGWSPDNKTLYFTHSNERTVHAYDYSPEDGSVSNERVFYTHEGPGEPDGFRVDVDGNLWHAVYGEYRVIKISPQGKIVGEVKLPTKNITCTQFVGTELFITSASEKDEEFSGGLFRVDVGTTGLEPFSFKL